MIFLDKTIVDISYEYFYIHVWITTFMTNLINENRPLFKRKKKAKEKSDELISVSMFNIYRTEIKPLNL